jgi:hypothetical protein
MYKKENALSFQGRRSECAAINTKLSPYIKTQQGVELARENKK